MAQFASALRRATALLASQSLEERSWEFVQLGIARGGLGLRGPTCHAAACSVASLLQARALRSPIDPGFVPSDAAQGAGLQETIADRRKHTLDGAEWESTGDAPGQKQLSALLDAAALAPLQARQAHGASLLAHAEL